METLTSETIFIDTLLITAVCIAALTAIIAWICFAIKARKLKKAFDAAEVGDVYVRKEDESNPFVSRRYYVYISKKGVSENGTRWVLYKTVRSDTPCDLKWENFHEWYVRVDKSVEEIRKELFETIN